MLSTRIAPMIAPGTTREKPQPFGFSPRTLLWLSFATIYLVWGSTYLAIVYALPSFPPFVMGALRFSLAGALLYGVARSQGAEKPTRRHWFNALRIGFLLSLLGNGLVVWAEQRLASGLAALLGATTPLWMVVLTWKTQRAKGLTTLGLLAGLAGVSLLSWQGFQGASGFPVPEALGVLGGCLAFAIGSLGLRNWEMPRSGMLASSMQMLCGGMLFSLVAALRGEWLSWNPAQVTPGGFAALLYLTLFGSVVAFSAYNYLLRHVPAAQASTHCYVNPLVAVLLGWVFLSEPLSIPLFGGMGLILMGVLAIHRANRR